MALFLLSMLLQSFYVIIERGTSSSRHIIDVVYDLNFTEKIPFQFLSTVQHPGAKGYKTHMETHSTTSTKYFSSDK